MSWLDTSTILLLGILCWGGSRRSWRRRAGPIGWRCRWVTARATQCYNTEEEVEDHARLCPGPLLSQIALCADREGLHVGGVVRPTCRRAA